MRDLPPRLEFERTVAGQRLVLPRRRAGKGVMALLFATFFGAIFAGLPGYNMGWPALQELAGDGPLAEKAFSAFLLLFVLPFVVIGTGVALGPWLVMLSRTTLILEHDELRVFRGIGPLGFSRRRSTRGIQGFEVEVGSSRTNGAAAKPIKSMTNLKALYEGDGKPMYVAVGYPQAVMRDLADVLRDTLQPRGWTTAEPELSITETLAGADSPDVPPGYNPDESIPPQPSKSNIVAEETASGTTYRVPSRGILKGSRGMWFFALFWNAITYIVLAAMLFGKVEEGANDMPWFIAVPFFGVFIAVGLGTAYAAIRMGTRSVSLDITGSSERKRLTLDERHAFGHTRLDLAPSDLTAIRVAPSGVSENDSPVHHLKMHITEDAARLLPKRWAKPKEIGLLLERDDDELRWLAARLRRDLKIGSVPPTDYELDAASHALDHADAQQI